MKTKIRTQRTVAYYKCTYWNTWSWIVYYPPKDGFNGYSQSCGPFKTKEAAMKDYAREKKLNEKIH